MTFEVVVRDVSVAVTVTGEVVKRDWLLDIDADHVAAIRKHATELVGALLRENGAHAGESWTIIFRADGPPVTKLLWVGMEAR